VVKISLTIYGPGEEFMKDKLEEPLKDLNPRQLSLEEHFSRNEHLTIQDFQNIHPDVTRRVLIRDLNDLVEKGFLKRHGVKRGTYYTLA
jgi:hypothetical protein